MSDPRETASVTDACHIDDMRTRSAAMSGKTASNECLFMRYYFYRNAQYTIRSALHLSPLRLLFRERYQAHDSAARTTYRVSSASQKKC
jgi:hypothetical protein